MDPATVPEQSVVACFNAAANSHLRKGPAPDGSRPVAVPVPVGLRAVYAARTSYAGALGVRAPGADTTYFTADERTRSSHGSFATTITAPADGAAATWLGLHGTGGPGGGVGHFFGHAHDDVAVVLLRTPDLVEHCAPVAGGLWWTPVLLDEASLGRAEHSRWRAVAADGTLLAEGTGPTR